MDITIDLDSESEDATPPTTTATPPVTAAAPPAAPAAAAPPAPAPDLSSGDHAGPSAAAAPAASKRAAPPASGRKRKKAKPSVRAGTRVRARWMADKSAPHGCTIQHKGAWFRGRVERVHPGGACDVRYDDGDFEANVLPMNVRPTSNEGDDPDDEEEEEAVAAADPAWQRSGHDLLGRRIRRHFDGHGWVGGVLVMWRPGPPESLFKAAHDDGDKEDLSEEQARQAVRDADDEDGAAPAPAAAAAPSKKASGKKAVHEAPAAAEVVEEAEGLKLHLSSKSSSGYLGVYKCPRDNGTYEARDTRNSEFKSLGIYDSALEAAVAYARRVGPPKEFEGLVQEAEGFHLHLSRRSNSTTGYTGVYMDDGKFKARHAVDGTTIGRFDTVVEAAVAYARHVAKKGAKGLPAPAPAAEPSKKAPSTARGGAPSKAPAAASKAPAAPKVVEEAEGFRLHLSAHSATGYKCVVPAPKQQGKFQARDQSGGVTSANAHLGTLRHGGRGGGGVCSAHGEEGGEGGPAEGSGRGGGGLPPAPQFEVGQLFRLHGRVPYARPLARTAPGRWPHKPRQLRHGGRGGGGVRAPHGQEREERQGRADARAEAAAAACVARRERFVVGALAAARRAAPRRRREVRGARLVGRGRFVRRRGRAPAAETPPAPGSGGGAGGGARTRAGARARTGAHSRGAGAGARAHGDRAPRALQPRRPIRHRL